MEVLSIKCPECSRLTHVKTEQLVPYSEKIVWIKCTNPVCGHQIKVQVPALKPAGQGSGSGQFPEIPPTEVLMPRASLIPDAQLRVHKNQYSKDQVFEIKDGLNTIGRLSNQTNDFRPDIALVTNDRKISRNHCQISRSTNQRGEIDFTLKDNNSRNGTYLNPGQQRLGPGEEVYLNNGDSFVLGETLFSIEFRQKE